MSVAERTTLTNQKPYTHFEFTGAMVTAYDRFNHFASFGQDIHWRRSTARYLVQFMETRRSAPLILDLACGTGDMALVIHKIAPELPIIGSDPSFEMLHHGMRKLRRIDGDNLLLLQAVSNLPFRGAQLDAITCAFGFRNFVHLERDLSRLRKHLKPGGRLYALEFYQPKTRFVQFFLSIYRKTMFPLLGLLLIRQVRPYSYLSNSILTFHTTDQFADLLQHCGYGRIEKKPFFFGLVHLIVAENPTNP